MYILSSFCIIIFTFSIHFLEIEFNFFYEELYLQKFKLVVEVIQKLKKTIVIKVGITILFTIQVGGVA